MGSSGVEFKRASSRWASTRRVGAARLSHTAARGPVADFIVAIVEMIFELPCLLRKEADLVESGGNTVAMRLEHSFLARP